MRTHIDTLTKTTQYVMTDAELRRYRYQIIKQYKAKKKEERKAFFKRIGLGILKCLGLFTIELILFAIFLMQI